MQSLFERGLVSFYKKNRAVVYKLESPDKFSHLLNLEKEVIREKEDRLGRIISELKVKTNPDIVLPKVEFFEGKKGYIDFAERSLECKSKEILFITSIDHFRGIVTTKYDTQKYIPTRLRKDIHLKLLTPRTTTTIDMKKNDKLEKRETRFIPEKFKIRNTIFIFDNSVALVSNKENPSCVLVTSREISHTLRKLFFFMWSKAEI